MAGSFKWLSPLGMSVTLFLVVGFLWLLIGALTLPMHARGAGFLSPRTDTEFFGRSPADLASDPVFSKFRKMMLTVVAGFLLLAGTLVITITWFGLRQGAMWALVGLSTGGLAAIALWGLVLLTYSRAGVRITLADVPPFMWVPAVLLLPATILGWLGLK